MLQSTSTASSARILLVDDCEEDRQLLGNLLRRQGYRLYIATDGRDGIEKARYVLPDLILMDIRMPGCDGIAACRLLKADPGTAQIPVIFLTAAGLPEERVRGLSEGAVDYIAKPYHFDEVRLRVAIHLASAPGHGPAPAEATASVRPAREPAGNNHPRSSVDHCVFRAAQRLLMVNLAATPELADLARAVGTNTRHLNDAFRRFAGVTALTYLREARMKEAGRLLRETGLDVQTIAMDLGYGNPANFSTAFRERFGMSPRQFRHARPDAEHLAEGCDDHEGSR